MFPTVDQDHRNAVPVLGPQFRIRVHIGGMPRNVKFSADPGDIVPRRCAGMTLHPHQQGYLVSHPASVPRDRSPRADPQDAASWSQPVTLYTGYLLCAAREVHRVTCGRRMLPHALRGVDANGPYERTRSG